MRITCPHCGERATISHSESITPEAKDIYANCLNPRCGARFVMAVTHKYDITPPANKIKSLIEEMISRMPLQDRADLLKKFTPAQPTLF